MEWERRFCLELMLQTVQVLCPQVDLDRAESTIRSALISAGAESSADHSHSKVALLELPTFCHSSTMVRSWKAEAILIGLWLLCFLYRILCVDI